jgi:hypothetical protein
MPAAKAFRSASVTYAIGRQLVNGTPRTDKLYKMSRMTQPKSSFASGTSDSGYTVGSGQSNQGRLLKEAFEPAMSIAGQMTTGALAMNLLGALGYMVLSVGTSPTGSYVTAGAIATRNSATVSVDDATGLAPGDWIQIGALATPGTPLATDKCEVHEIASIATNTLSLKGKLLYKYATATPVKKVDKTKSVRHYFKHLEQDQIDQGAGDLWTVYMKLSNGTDTLEVLKYDGLATSFSPALSTGQIATLNSDLKFLDVTLDPATLAGVTLLPDPSPVLLNNTRGAFTLLGDSVNAPRSLNIGMTSSNFDDVVLTQYKKQSNIHLDHAINISTSGKFVLDLFKLVNMGSTSGTEFTDEIPEGAFLYQANSAKLIGASTDTYYGFGLNAPTCQLSGYDPEINTNQVADANLEMLRVVTNEATDEKEWFYFLDNACTTDVLSAA